MTLILSVVHILVALALIFVVLVQKGSGADMGAAFGGSSQSVFGARGSGSFLGKVTALLATVFMLTSLSLAFFSTQESGRESIMEGAQAPSGSAAAPSPGAPPGAPAIPEPAPEIPAPPLAPPPPAAATPAGRAPTMPIPTFGPSAGDMPEESGVSSPPEATSPSSEESGPSTSETSSDAPSPSTEDGADASSPPAAAPR